MIEALIFLLFTTFIFALLYLSMRFSLKKLQKDMIKKRETQTNLLLTTDSQDLEMKKLVGTINITFEEFRAIKIKALNDQKSFELAMHNITHDIRTPLMIASGYSQTLLKNEQLDLSALTKIKQNLDIVSKRLEILLDYQNLLEDNVKLEMTKVNLIEVLKTALLKDYDVFTERNFAVEIDLPDLEELFIVADRELLERIIQNLLGNILKHGKEKMKIQLQVVDQQIKLTFINQTQQPIRSIEKLTNRFYSENLSSTEGSSGLGLFITQELVVLISGKMELFYKDNEFRVNLLWKYKESKI